MNDEVYNLGVRLRSLREAMGLTQEEVGNRIGVKKATVNKYENNATLPPVHRLETMAVMYKTSMDYLLNLEKRDCIFIDDLPPAQRKLIKSTVDILKQELKMLGSNKTGD